MSRRRKKNSLEPEKATPPKKAGEGTPPGLGSARRMPVGKKMLFSAVVSIGFLGLAELVLWLAGAPSLIEREDPFRGFSGIVTVFERNGDVFRTRAVSAKDTFNDQSFLVDKPAGGVRIFCLGGSSAYGFPWGAEAAFTGILGDVLAASHPQLHIEAVNASGLSYGMHRVNLVADELLGYEPDIFIVYSGHNEFVEPAFFEALKHRSVVRTRGEYLLAHSRVYAAMRSAFESLAEANASTRDDFGTLVRRDETRVFSAQEKAAIVAEFRWRLERLVSRARKAGVKVVLVTVPANLRQWRPQASTGLAALTEDRRREWSEAFASAKRRLQAGEFEAAAADLEEAARIAPSHAETQFLLGQACEKLGRFDEARLAYGGACDADASPIRRVSGINDAIREMARQQGVLLLDADRIFEQQSEHGLVGYNLIEDYVHPTRAGHELIAWHLWEAMEQAGWFGDKANARREVFDEVLVKRHRRPERKTAVWLYNQGVALQNQGQWEAAIEKYREAFAMMPNHEGTVHNLSALLIDTGRSAEAVGLLKRLVELNPDLGEARYNLGNALQDLGRFEEAIKNYEEAARLRPAFADIHVSWGITLQKLKRCEEAIGHYQRALELKPDDPNAHNNWGIALQSLGRFEEAVAQYQEALRLRPELAAAHNNWGLTLESSGRFDEAAAHYQQALQLKPDDAAACRHLGDLFRRRGELGKAEGHYRNAIRLQPDFAAAYYGLGVVLHQQGRSGEAIAQLEQGLLANPQDLVLHSALATIAKQCGDVRKELTHLQTIVQQDASNLPAVERLAWILATSDEDSLRDGKRALQLAQHGVAAGGREQAGPLETLAAAFAETGDFAEAVRWQRKVVELASEPAQTQARQRLQLYEAGKPFRWSPAEMSER